MRLAMSKVIKGLLKQREMDYTGGKVTVLVVDGNYSAFRELGFPFLPLLPEAGGMLNFHLLGAQNSSSLFFIRNPRLPFTGS